MSDEPATAMRALERGVPDHIYFEARRIADERDLSYEDLPKVMQSLALREFQENIRPWMDQKVKLRAVCISRPLYSVDAFGRPHLESIDDGMTPEIRALGAKMDDLIAAERRRYPILGPAEI